MIGRIIGYSLYYGLGVGSAVLAMVTVLPSARLSGGVAPKQFPAAEHAVFVSGQQGAAVTADQPSPARCPYLAAVSAQGRCPALRATSAAAACPYLAALGARNGCPALRGSGGAAGCPALEHPRAEEPNLQDGASPGLTDPATGWRPPGTVLAVLDGTATSADTADLG